jgi:uncharacterized protein (UPF0332 family)
MNDENKKAAVQEELARADEAYRAAELLFENDLLPDAVSKLYYYLLYHLRALLLLKNLEPRSHEGVLRLFGLHFVKNGPFEAKDSHVVSKMMKLREEADYNPSYTFTSEDYSQFKNEVSEVSEKVKKLLAEKGYP